jgi:hypothetical protein
LAVEVPGSVPDGIYRPTQATISVGDYIGLTLLPL